MITSPCAAQARHRSANVSPVCSSKTRPLTRTGAAECVLVLGVISVAHAIRATVHSTKKCVEKITLVLRLAILKTRPSRRVPARPAGWWREVLPGLVVGPKLVVGGSFFRVFQNIVGLCQRLEAGLCIFFLADIRVVLAGQFAVRALDVFRPGAFFDAHRLVIVLEFHLSLSALAGKAWN